MRNGKRIILAVLGITTAALGIKYYLSVRNADAIPVEAAMVKNSEWDKIISETANRTHIGLVVDGKHINIDSRDIFMNSSKKIMINSEVLRDIFACSVSVSSEEHIVIEKSNTKIILDCKQDGAVVNGIYHNSDVRPAVLDNIIYIPGSVFENYFSYEYKWNYKENQAVFSNTRPDEKIYPFAYDYRSDGRIIRVKNQADLGTCWAFASLTALETSLMPEHIYDFSEDHMSCHNGYNLSQSEGGEYNMSMAYLASWKGPVLEEEDPYGDGISPDGLTSHLHVQEMQIIPSKDLDGIKKAVFLYGGVQSSLYMSAYDSYGNSSSSYNSDNYSYCYIGKEKANHDVVIVGWDDSYSAANFSTEPEGDGAFICVNSWGEEFGDKGYFYVSYYDSCIGVHNLVYTRIESSDNYDNIYQSDLCGWIGQLGYNREYAYFANAYTSMGNELLEAVGFYATAPGTSYEIFVVEDFQGNSSFANKKPVASGSLGNGGYYTIRLDEKIFIPAGKKYAVVVYINTPGATKPIAIEYRGGASTATVDLSDGEGYISLHGNNWERVEDTQRCNICLKAYTRNISVSNTH
ncbi:MAG: lectin like domain-containing protein [Butyrivibrio sp.]